MSPYLETASRLHSYIIEKHWDGRALIGPDPIGKIHWRITRFVRSYLPWLPREDRHVFYQGLAYWIKGNLLLFELTKDRKYLDIARQCADYIVDTQRDDGAWNYPNLTFRKGKVATVEGGWASLALVDTHRFLGDDKYLQAAIKWYDVMVNVIGFSAYKDSLCVNYYQTPVGMVPNNATIALWLNAELFDVTGDQRFMEYSDPQIRFLQYSQFESGELSYAFNINYDHLFCYQYNAFEFLDLANYYNLAKDDRVWQILDKLARYLSGGVLENGACKGDCFKETPEVNYWTVALATALHKAHKMGLGAYLELSERAYERALSQQNRDGGFGFSKRDYGFLKDRRSYPRYLSMIFNHLLIRASENGHDKIIKYCAGSNYLGR